MAYRNPISRAVTLLALTTLIVSISPACSGRQPSQQPSESDGPTSQPASQQPAPKPPARVGETLELARIGDGRIAVTLQRVIEPATVSSFMNDPGKTYIATELTIRNIGASTIVGDANNDVSVIGSDQHGYRADLATVAECQNFTYGGFLLAPDSSATGCVTFALPPGVSAVRIKYSPSSGLSHDVGEWSAH